MARKLKITVFHARGLKNTQHIGKQDPYVEVTCGTQTWRSAAHKGAGATAQINESCCFNLTSESFIDISVMNHNMLMAHAAIGTARVALESVLQKGSETKEVPISDKKKYAAGTVELRLDVENETTSVSLPCDHAIGQAPVALYPLPDHPSVHASDPTPLFPTPPYVSADVAKPSAPPAPSFALYTSPSPAYAPTPYYPEPLFLGESGVSSPLPTVPPSAHHYPDPDGRYLSPGGYFNNHSSAPETGSFAYPIQAMQHAYSESWPSTGIAPPANYPVPGGGAMYPDTVHGAAMPRWHEQLPAAMAPMPPSQTSFNPDAPQMAYGHGNFSATGITTQPPEYPIPSCNSGAQYGGQHGQAPQQMDFGTGIHAMPAQEAPPPGYPRVS